MQTHAPPVYRNCSCQDLQWHLHYHPHWATPLSHHPCHSWPWGFHGSHRHSWASQVALVVKNPSANSGRRRDIGSIPGLGRSAGEGHGNSLQYSCLENPMDRGAWRATVHRVAKSGTWLKPLSMHTHTHTHSHSWTSSLLFFLSFLGRQVTIYLSEMICKHNLFKKQRTGVLQLKTNLGISPLVKWLRLDPTHNN